MRLCSDLCSFLVKDLQSVGSERRHGLAVGAERQLDTPKKNRARSLRCTARELARSISERTGWQEEQQIAHLQSIDEKVSSQAAPRARRAMLS